MVLIESPPEEFRQLCVLDYREIQDVFRSFDYSLGIGTEIPTVNFDKMLNMKKINLSSSSKDLLLKALSNNPSRSVNLRIFMALLKFWQTNGTFDEKIRVDSDSVSKIHELLSAVPELYLIFDNFKLSIKEIKSKLLSREEFLKLYPNLNPNALDYLHQFGYYKISNNFVEFGRLIEDINNYMYSQEDSKGHDMAKVKQSIVLEAIEDKFLENYAKLASQLLNYKVSNDHGGVAMVNIEKQKLFDLLWRTGSLFSASDFDAFWDILKKIEYALFPHIFEKNDPSLLYVNVLEEFADQHQNKQEWIQSSISAIMRDLPAPRLRKPSTVAPTTRIKPFLTTDASTSNTDEAIAAWEVYQEPRHFEMKHSPRFNSSSSIGNLLSWQDSTVPSNAIASPSTPSFGRNVVSCQPWQKDSELKESSNTKSKILIRLKTWNSVQLERLADTMEEIVRQHGSLLTRRLIAESLLQFQVRLLPSDYDNMWTELVEFSSPNAPSVVSFFQWLNLPLSSTRANAANSNSRIGSSLSSFSSSSSAAAASTTTTTTSSNAIRNNLLFDNGLGDHHDIPKETVFGSFFPSSAKSRGPEAPLTPVPQSFQSPSRQILGDLPSRSFPRTFPDTNNTPLASPRNGSFASPVTVSNKIGSSSLRMDGTPVRLSAWNEKDMYPCTPKSTSLQTSVGQGVINRKLIGINKLLSLKPYLAILFRRVSQQENSESNSISCKEFARNILLPPIEVDMSFEEAWQLVCEIIGMEAIPSDQANNYRISFEQLLDYLNQDTIGPNQELICLESIRSKLRASKILQGDRVKLLASTSHVRNRYRSLLTRGNVTSWDINTEQCSLVEFRKLLEYLDLFLTDSEVLYLYQRSRRSSSDSTHHELDDRSPSTLAMIAIGDGMIQLSNCL